MATSQGRERAAGGLVQTFPKPGSESDDARNENAVLKSETAELEAQVAIGSAIAQRKLAKIYGECFAYSIDPNAHFATIDALAALSARPKQAFESVKSRTDK